MSDFDFNFDSVEDLPEILEEANGDYVGELTVTQAKAKKGSLGRALRVKFLVTEGEFADKVILARIGLTNNDGSPSYDAPAFKRLIKPFLVKANLDGQLANVLALFSDFSCKATFKTDDWTTADGEERKSVRLIGLAEKA